jgi:type IV pilus assembly protein PilF
MMSSTLSLRWISLALLFWVSGCAPGGLSGAVSGSEPRVDLLTESDETVGRRRARIRIELASAYFQQGQSLVALDEIKQALTIDPTYIDAYNLRGLVYWRLNNLPLATDSFQRALVLSPKDPDVAHNYGWLLCRQSRFEESARYFAMALDDPGYGLAAKTWAVQGLCQLQAGRPQEAEASLLRSLQLDPDGPLAAYQLARLLFDRGDFLSAQPYLRKLNNGSLGNAESLWLGIKVEQQLNNPSAVAVLADQLRGRFSQSRELNAYERRAFHE